MCSLIKHMPQLRESLILPDLLWEMVKDESLPATERDDIMSEDCDEAVLVEKFVKCLQNKPENRIPQLLKALEKTNQQHLVYLICDKGI